MHKKSSRRRSAPAQGVFQTIVAAGSPDEVDEILSGGDHWGAINEGIRRERRSPSLQNMVLMLSGSDT
ncbi:MAG: hypothetical protein ABH851_09325 [Methanobacteriota archaeon]